MKVDAIRLAELCAKGLNANQIAARLGVSKNAVFQRAKALGISVAAAPHGKTGIYFASRA